MVLIEEKKYKTGSFFLVKTEELAYMRVMKEKNSRTLVIYNPTAGKGRAASQQQDVENKLHSVGLSFLLQRTEAPGHAFQLAKKAGDEGFSLVVAAGGDGTANEVLNGLLQVREAEANGSMIPHFAVLPLGRGNDFSHGVGVPGDWGEAIDLLATGVSRPMDAGKITGGDYPQGKYFGNGIGIGFDTRVGLEASKMTWAKGSFAYVFGALKTFALYPPAPDVSIHYNGQKLDLTSHQISIMNGTRMGGVFFMAPDAKTDDGLLDMCVAGNLNRRAMVDLMVRYTKGTQADHPQVQVHRAPHYTIQARSGSLVCHADGETICLDGKELQVECLPQALMLRGSRHAVSTTGNPVTPGAEFPQEPLEQDGKAQ